MVKGKKEDAVSELAEGRRTIVRDVDDPAFEANILDSLMVSREEEISAELEAAYLPVGIRASPPWSCSSRMTSTLIRTSPALL